MVEAHTTVVGNAAIRAFGFFLFGEPLLDTGQADRARWANQFLPLRDLGGPREARVEFSMLPPQQGFQAREEKARNLREAGPQGMSRGGSGSWVLAPELLHGLSGLLECTWITGRQVFPQKNFPASPRWTMDEPLWWGDTLFLPGSKKGGWMLGWEWSRPSVGTGAWPKLPCEVGSDPCPSRATLHV